MLRHNEWVRQQFAKSLTVNTKHEVINSYGDVIAEFEYLQQALDYIESTTDETSI